MTNNIKTYYQLNTYPGGYSHFFKLIIKKCLKVITITRYEYRANIKKQWFEKIASRNIPIEDVPKMWNLNKNSTFEDFCEQYRYFKSILTHTSEDWLYEKEDFIKHWKNQQYYINIIENDN